LLDDAVIDPYTNRDKLVVAKYLMEDSLNKTNTNNESTTVKRIVDVIDKLLSQTR